MAWGMGQKLVPGCEERKPVAHPSLGEWKKADSPDKEGMFSESDGLCFEVLMVWTGKTCDKK